MYAKLALKGYMYYIFKVKNIYEGKSFVILKSLLLVTPF